MAEGLSVGNLALAGGLARITGTSSKLDTESIVAAAYEARRLPAVRLEQRITGNEARGAAFGELRGLLQSLKNALGGLRNPPGLLGVNENLFDAKQVSVNGGGLGDPSQLVDVTAENRAVVGSFMLDVEQLATAHKLAARPFALAGQTVSEAWNGGASFAGTLELGLAGGAKATVAVDGAMDVEDLRAAINAVSAQSGVTASVLTVSPTEQRLIITAAETGRAIELGDTGGDPVTGLLGAATLQAPQGSRVVIDGVAVERAGNRIDDALAGVSIDLYGASPGTEMTIKIEPSLGGAKEQIGEFVSAYNALRDFVARQSTVGSDGALAEDAVLFGDRTLRGLAQSLSSMVGNGARGLAPDALSTLRDVGISMEAGGRLRLDETVLDARLLSRLDDVRCVFEFQARASSGDLGVLARTNAFADTDFTVAIADADNDGRPESATLDGVPAVVDGNRIRGADGTDYEGLTLIWTGNGSASIDLSLSQGVADRLYSEIDRILDPSDGPIGQAQSRLDAANAAFTRQIARIDERADQARERMRARFAAMEAALGLANTMLSQVRAQMDAMTGPS